MAQGCIRSVIGSYDVDSVITTGKSEIQSKIREELMAQLEDKNIGIQLVNLSIQDAMNSEDYIIKILAILDKRVGKRTLQKIKESEEYKKYPEWARQFYELRLKESV